MVSIIITCGPGYDRWVSDAVASALIQGPGVEIVVVFDRCFPPRTWPGVVALQIDAGNVHTARRTGYLASTGDAVLFLDADDMLPWGFIDSATTQLVAATADDSRVVGIYPSAEYSRIDTGETQRHWDAPPWSLLAFECENFLLISTLVWRKALQSALREDFTHDQLEDYAMWRAVVQAGGIFRRGEYLKLHVRTHPDSLTNAHASRSYSRAHDLQRQGNTVFAVVSDLPGAIRIAKWLPFLQDGSRVVICVIGNADLYTHVSIHMASLHPDLRVFRGTETTEETLRAVHDCPTPFITLVDPEHAPATPPDLTRGFEGDVAAVGWAGGSKSAHDTTFLGPGVIMARTKAVQQVAIPVTDIRIWRNLIAAGWRVREI